MKILSTMKHLLPGVSIPTSPTPIMSTLQYTVQNPADNQVFATVDMLDTPTSTTTNDKEIVKSLTRLAIVKATSKFSHFKHTTSTHRAKMLNDWASNIRANASNLATLMTLESGKPYRESMGEVEYGATFLDYYAGTCLRPSGMSGGTIIPSPFPSTSNASRGTIMNFNEPVGPCAFITPWNFPLAMITRKVGPAIAAGCTSVLKPSELTPITAIALRELGREAGVEDGIFEVLPFGPGGSEGFGEVVCKDDDIKKISFTGSTRVGKILHSQCGEGGIVKRMSLELGGNAPFVVFDDADMDTAVEAAVKSKFRNSGQTCVCSDRFLISSSRVEEFTERMKSIVNDMKVGEGMDESSDITPLITPEAARNVMGKVEECETGEVIAGGGYAEELGPNYMRPTLILNPEEKERVWKEETFGPVASIRSFHDEEEALEVIKKSNTGLASYFVTKDLARVFRFGRELPNGMVGVNEGIISSAQAPFGGVGESGIGREGSGAGMEEYLEKKYMFVNH